MRSTAEISEIALCIESDLAIVEIADQIRVHTHRLFSEVADGFCFGNGFADIGIILLRQFIHFLFSFVRSSSEMERPPRSIS